MFLRGKYLSTEKLRVSDSGSNNHIECRTPDLTGNIAIKGDNNRVLISKVSNPGTVDILIEGSGSEIEIQEVRRFGAIRIIAKNGGRVCLGKSSTVEQGYFLADGSNITVGRDCMISFNVTIRTTDAHGIYDRKDGKLLNPPADVILEDHVWLGQGCTLLKGAHVKRNSVVGAGSVLSGKIYPDHAIIAGIPGKVIREGVFWDRRMTKNAFSEGANVDHMLFDHLD